MKSLSDELTSLLDKLYNLRGENSVILTTMAKEKNEAESTKENANTLKEELQNKIADLEKKESILDREGEKLIEALLSIDKSEFTDVIEYLEINFNPEQIRKEVEKSLPLTKEKVMDEKKNTKSELAKVEDEMNEAITKMEEVELRYDEALTNQEKLNKYFEMALNGSINVTRDEITTLLSKFDFTEEEKKEAAKILMFPEDGLYEYENIVKEQPTISTSIGEIIKEAKEVNPVVETSDQEDNNVIINNENIVQEENNDLINVEINNEPVTQEVKSVSKEDIINILTKLGFDSSDFTDDNINKLIKNYDEPTFVKNSNYIDSLNIGKDILYNNIELLYDKELELKFEKLTSLGKTSQDIYLNPSVLTKYSYNELEEVINTLNENGLDPQNVPLMAF